MRPSFLLLALIFCSFTCTIAQKVSYYDLLEVEQTATDRELKKAYRAMALKWHPDKQSDPAMKEQASIEFQTRAYGYQVLSDPEKRAKYDILLTQGIYVFKEHDYDPIRAYAEADGLDEEQSLILITLITMATGVYPAFVVISKRKQDAATAAKKKKDMIGSIHKSKRSAVTTATATTPTDNSLNSASQSTSSASVPESDDNDTSAAATAKREKVEAKRIRSSMRTVCKRFLIVEEGDVKQGAKKQITSEEVDLVCTSLTSDELSTLLSQLCTSLSLDPASLDEPTLSSITPTSQELSSARLVMRTPIERVRTKLAEQKGKEKARLAEQKFQQRKAAEEQAAMNTTEWTQEEISMLAKGMAKFPGGIPQRWERIAELVNQVGKRTVKQVTAKAKEHEVLKPIIKDDKTAAFNSYKANVKKLAPDAAASVENAGSGLSTNDLAIAVAQSFAPIAEQTKGSNVSLHQPAAETVKPVVTEQVEEKKAPEKLEWTAEQQAALEMALRTVPRDAEDRWDQIAALVPGRTKKQVIQRFKEIKALVMSTSA